MHYELWSLLYYGVLVIGLAAVMISLSYVLGQKHRDEGTDTPYESGISASGSAKIRISVNFYLVALLFVIFDIEAVFLFAWAVAARSLGWTGYLGAATFIAILVVALIYEWRMGALNWGNRSSERGSSEYETTEHESHDPRSVI